MQQQNVKCKKQNKIEIRNFELPGNILILTDIPSRQTRNKANEHYFAALPLSLLGFESAAYCDFHDLFNNNLTNNNLFKFYDGCSS